ncbi:hypothetical protein AAIG87_35495 [Pseudomonas aeruginosa]|uniref:hypothetical protein n=1 Tax=Pseudomonas aeruginosa TaxID=287 RepID=UPI0031B6E23C
MTNISAGVQGVTGKALQNGLGNFVQRGAFQCSGTKFDQFGTQLVALRWDMAQVALFHQNGD